jgi:hypothetical protein
MHIPSLPAVPVGTDEPSSFWNWVPGGTALVPPGTARAVPGGNSAFPSGPKFTPVPGRTGPVPPGTEFKSDLRELKEVGPGGTALVPAGKILKELRLFLQEPGSRRYRPSSAGYCQGGTGGNSDFPSGTKISSGSWRKWASSARNRVQVRPPGTQVHHRTWSSRWFPTKNGGAVAARPQPALPWYSPVPDLSILFS